MVSDRRIPGLGIYGDEKRKLANSQPQVSADKPPQSLSHNHNNHGLPSAEAQSVDEQFPAAQLYFTAYAFQQNWAPTTQSAQGQSNSPTTGFTLNSSTSQQPATSQAPVSIPAYRTGVGALRREEVNQPVAAQVAGLFERVYDESLAQSNVKNKHFKASHVAQGSSGRNQCPQPAISPPLAETISSQQTKNQEARNGPRNQAQISAHQVSSKPSKYPSAGVQTAAATVTRDWNQQCHSFPAAEAGSVLTSTLPGIYEPSSILNNGSGVKLKTSMVKMQHTQSRDLTSKSPHVDAQADNAQPLSNVGLPRDCNLGKLDDTAQPMQATTSVQSATMLQADERIHDTDISPTAESLRAAKSAQNEAPAQLIGSEHDLKLSRARQAVHLGTPARSTETAPQPTYFVTGTSQPAESNDLIRAAMSEQAVKPSTQASMDMLWGADYIPLDDSDSNNVTVTGHRDVTANSEEASSNGEEQDDAAKDQEPDAQEDEHTEWEIDSNPILSDLDSSDSSDYVDDDSSDEDSSDVDDVKIELESPSTESRATERVPEPIRTKNEKKRSVFPIPDVKLGPHDELRPLGTIMGNFSSTGLVHVTIYSLDKGQANRLNMDTVVFKQNRTAIGCIHDVFGPTVKPVYLILYNTPAEIEHFDLQLGEMLYFSPEHATFFNLPDLFKQKMTDASNIYDEEINEAQQDFSDDEKEAEFKRARRQKKGAWRGCQGSRGGRGGRGRGGRYRGSYTDPDRPAMESDPDRPIMEWTWPPPPLQPVFRGDSGHGRGGLGGSNHHDHHHHSHHQLSRLPSPSPGHQVFQQFPVLSYVQSGQYPPPGFNSSSDSAPYHASIPGFFGVPRANLALGVQNQSGLSWSAPGSTFDGAANRGNHLN